ncbi:MAG: filamentous hemagglutinin N-terminal domain-containing protein [Xenococcaceae cyanobacterium]
MNKIISSLFQASCFAFSSLLASMPAFAQEVPITADGTTDTNITTPDGSNFDLDGGDRAGGNLFHSFGDFSVPNGGSANFLNPTDIENIISRVTGGKISTIEGLIRANGSANLFLINPAGIVFGQNASLNIGGSFLGSTADSLVFPDGEFSALNAQGKPLLTINAPIGLNLRDNPAPITLKNSTTSIQVGKNLSLVGGNISLDNSALFLSGGKIELGGLSAAGTITFNQDASLKFPDNVAKSDISLINNSLLSLNSFGGGIIAINSKKISLDNSVLSSGIFEELGIFNSQVGNIDINTDSVFLTNNSIISANTFGVGDVGDININAKKQISLDNSLIANYVGSKGQGNSGNIDINTGSLSLTNDARLSTATFGQGNSGSITINSIDDVFLSDRSIIDSFIGINGSGKSGNIAIATKNFSIANGGSVSTATSGKGDSGNISIQASDNISIDGQGSSGFGSGILTSTDVGGIGNSGSLNIKTGSLSLTNGAVINASTFGVGNSGNISIQATERISIDGRGSSGFSSGIFSNVGSIGLGSAGDINIATNFLNLTNGAQVSASLFGIGSAGNVRIDASDSVILDGVSPNNGLSSGVRTSVEREGRGIGGNLEFTSKNLTVTNGAQISAATFGEGNAGNVSVNVQEKASFDGVGIIGFSSGVFSNVSSGAIGNTGNIEFNTGSLSLNNGAFLDSSTFGQGNAGNIIINAKDDVSLVNGNISSSIESGGEGNGGDIDINARSLSLQKGAQIRALGRGSETSRNLPGGKGNSGNIIIETTDNVSLDGASIDGQPSSILSNVGSGLEGNAGSITITTDRLNLTNGAQISVANQGLGNGGSLEISANSIDLDRASLLASTNSGIGGNTNIQVSNILSLRNNSKIDAGAFGDANGGNVNINAGFIVAYPSKASNDGNDIIANAQLGRGGNINISTERLFQLQVRSAIPGNGTNDIDASSAFEFSDFLIDDTFQVTEPSLPANVIEPEKTVAQACGSGSDIAGGNTFTVSGRGGMPPSPTEPLESNTIRVSGDRKSPEAQEVKKSNRKVSSDEIIPARGMMINEKGQVVLTRYPTPNSIDRPIPQSNYCSSSVTDKEQSDRYSIVYDDELSSKFEEILKRSIAKFSKKS